MKDESYLELDFHDIKTPVDLDRREFVKKLGGGLIVILSLGDFSDLHAEILQRRPMPTDLNVYLQIKEDGRVNLYTGKIEMGQGVVTSLAQMLADELDVKLDDVDMVMGDTLLCPWDMGTFGSMSTRFFGPPLRAAGAEARAVLVEMAAEKLKVPKEQFRVNEGTIYDSKKSQRKITYAELTHGEKIVKQLSGKPKLKDPSEFKIMGKPVKRMDSHLKVTGEAKYAGDIRLPGMLSAKILRPPAHEATLNSLDYSAIKGRDDLIIVNEKDLFAVLHTYPEDAQQALNKVKAIWDSPSSSVNDENIFGYLLDKAGQGETVDSGGDLKAGEAESQHIVEKEYLNSYVAHSPMEPHSATADFKNGMLTIWASTQTPFRLQESAAELLGLSVENVHVMQNFVGGGFGGKSNNQQALEVARLTKLTGRPVQLIWSRKEEFFYDTFRPAAVVKIKSGITGGNKLSFWDYKVFYAGDRGSQQFYDIPNHQTVSVGGWSGRESVHPFGTGAWRAPANNTNTFARESQIDIMAQKAGMDPLEFRLKNLKDTRMIRVLKKVAEKAGYKPSSGPSGRGIGIACGMDAGACVAHIAEVDVDRKTGMVQLKRVVCAQDMGLVINPQGARIQIEGCINMGLGYALSEEVRFEGGKINTQNFDDYAFTHFSWIPEIESVFIDAQNEPAQGGGEPAIICMGAVVANAICDAVGARLYQLPMTPERVLAAIG